VAVGGGAWLNGAAASLENCTIADNIGGTSGAGLQIAAGSVTNCVLYGNRFTNAVVENVNSAGVARCWYSCAPELTNAANHNITGNPMFANASANDYRLTSARRV
jgi:hypothetical protein